MPRLNKAQVAPYIHKYNDIDLKEKIGNFSQGHKLMLTPILKQLESIRRKQNAKTICVDGYSYFFDGNRYCGCC